MSFIGNRIHMRAAQRAMEISGGIAPLALYVGVPPVLVAAWIAGSSELPPAAFLSVVGILLDHAAPRMRGVIPPSLVESFRHREAANW